MNENKYQLIEMKGKLDFQSPFWTAFFGTLTVGFFTHMFGLVNVLHNYDNIAVQPEGYGTGVTSGRWLLSLLGDFAEKLGGNYNLSFVNGVLFLALIGLSAAFLVDLFQVQKRGFAFLIGGLFAVFPSAFVTLAFRYTAVYYGLAILLSVLAAWVLFRSKWGILLSALCTSGSLGIYQAYVPMTICLLVLVLILKCLDEKAEFRKLVPDCLSCCCALILGLLLYFLFLNGTLALYHTTLSDYQGVDSMGKLSLSRLPELVVQAYVSFCTMPIRNYCGLAGMKLIKLIYLLLAALSVAVGGYLVWKKVRKPLVAVLLVVLCVLFPLAVNFVVVMCPDSWIYTLMVYAFVLIACVPLLLVSRLSEEKRPHSLLQKIVALLVCVLIACYSYQTNVNYTALYYSNRQVENYFNAMVTQIRMTEGFRADQEWAMLGTIQDPLLECYWDYEMGYDGIKPAGEMVHQYSWVFWIWNYVGYLPKLADEQTIEALWEREEVRQMPCWPDYGSIRVIGDTVVIKCEEQP